MKPSERKGGRIKTCEVKNRGVLILSDEELDDVVSHLIRRRESERDARLRRLVDETKRLVARKARLATAEEIRAFKEILALHRARRRRE